MAYTGIPEPLRREVLERDNHRCRWCGATNRGGDLHHIEYRRGYSYDRLDNLITLCRTHHSFVHGIPNAAGQSIVKSVAQRVLQDLVSKPGLTGSAVWRALRAQWAREGRCERHGEKADACLDCGIPGGACVECGNDDPCEGYKYCSDCLELLDHRLNPDGRLDDQPSDEEVR